MSTSTSAERERQRERLAERLLDRKRHAEARVLRPQTDLGRRTYLTMRRTRPVPEADLASPNSAAFAASLGNAADAASALYYRWCAGAPPPESMQYAGHEWRASRSFVDGGELACPAEHAAALGAVFDPLILRARALAEVASELPRLRLECAFATLYDAEAVGGEVGMPFHRDSNADGSQSVGSLCCFPRALGITGTVTADHSP